MKWWLALVGSECSPYSEVEHALPVLFHGTKTPTTIAPNQHHINSSSYGQDLGDSALGEGSALHIMPWNQG
jgi:hypothetical protein